MPPRPINTLFAVTPSLQNLKSGSPSKAFFLALGVFGAAALVGAIVSYLLSRIIVVRGIRALLRRSKREWPKHLLEEKLFAKLALLVPGILLYVLAIFFLPEVGSSTSSPGMVVADWIRRLLILYLIVVAAILVEAVLDCVQNVYRSLTVSEEVPIKGFLQAAELVAYVVCLVLAVAVLARIDLWKALAAIGGIGLILTWVFKDSIHALVACIQIISIDLVARGDWISMPKFGADGVVKDIGLHVVTVENFDKTIVAIPTSALIAEPFRNWQGMKLAGVRRIKRAIYIDVNSIQFCDSKMLARFERFHLLADRIRTKREEVRAFNEQRNINTRLPINGRKLTNIGTFRAYVEEYLRNHEAILKEQQDEDGTVKPLTCLVRQLPPGREGLPIEIYAFCRETGLAAYEQVQADIFDHLLAVVPLFDLKIFQDPTGHDFSASFDRAEKQPGTTRARQNSRAQA